MKSLQLWYRAWLLVFATGLLSFVSSGQKSYRVGDASWTFTKPPFYETRLDNFSSAMKTGDSIARKNSEGATSSTDDVVLVAVAREVTRDINIVFASYKSNAGIRKFSLPVYVDKLAELLRYNYQQMGSDAQVTQREAVLDKVKFYVIESRIVHKEKNYTYWTRLYVTELGGKEFTITASWDNEADKAAIETALATSQFGKS